MELAEIRREIDRIDDEMLRLFCRRMDCAGQVAAYKAVHGMPVLNTAREQQVLDGVRQGAGPYGDAAAVVFSTMMDVSRALQHRRLAAGDALRETLGNAQHTLFEAGQHPRIVCAGCPGAYADEAAGLLFPDAHTPQGHLAFVETFADVVAAVREGRADYGILPIENSSTGSVHEVYDLVMANRCTIAAAAELPVRHCLAALPGAELRNLRAVYSHPQGLSQCAEYIAAHCWQSCACSNTAVAAEMVSRSGDTGIAAIASRRAAALYGLTVLEDGVQTAANNRTRFIAISSRLVIPQDADKISLLFSLPHVTGSLYRTLARFAIEGLNLTKMESRPLRTGEFEYAFYLDFEGSLAHPATLDLLCALSEELPMFSFLGSYREISA